MKYIQPITHVDDIEPLIATMLSTSSNVINGTNPETLPGNTNYGAR